MSPLSQRVQTIPHASEAVFVDTTASVDTDGHAVTLLMCATPAGAIPLGSLITVGQDEGSFTVALR